MRLRLQQLVPRRMQQLIADDSGVVDAGQYILIVTLLGIGMVAGLIAFRNQVVQEFGDIADGIESLDQSYSVTYFDGDGNVVKEVVFDQSNPPAPVPPPAFPAPTGEMGPGGGSPPAGLSLTVPGDSE